MNKSVDDRLDPKATNSQSSKTDFDRNRDGVYGGLPKVRQDDAPGPEPESPEPSDNKAA